MKAHIDFVGAGPGSADFLTLKAARLLAQAEVVFYDDLVDASVLALAASAEKIWVGKRAGKFSTLQTTIGEHLSRAAIKYQKIVRLKGGDPSIFGRLAEETAVCEAEGISYAVTPGISAACAAAAQLATSLTLREVAREVHFITGSTFDDQTSGPQTVPHPSSTLAVYMGSGALQNYANNLLSYGWAGATPVLRCASIGGVSENFIALDMQSVAQNGVSKADAPVLYLIGAAFKATAEKLQKPQKQRKLEKQASLKQELSESAA